MRLITAIIITVVIGCNHNQSLLPAKDENTADTVSYFQLREYIQTQLNEISGYPYHIFKITNSGYSKDSLPITPGDVNLLATNFINADINAPSIHKQYKENVFMDQTTKSYTLSYTTTNNDLEVQNIDVLLDEDAQTVKRIFIRKFKRYDNDSAALEQLSWKPNQQFQINRMIQIPGEKDKIEQTTVYWTSKN